MADSQLMEADDGTFNVIGKLDKFDDYFVPRMTGLAIALLFAGLLFPSNISRFDPFQAIDGGSLRFLENGKPVSVSSVNILSDDNREVRYPINESVALVNRAAVRTLMLDADGSYVYPSEVSIVSKDGVELTEALSVSRFVWFKKDYRYRRGEPSISSYFVAILLALWAIKYLHEHSVLRHYSSKDTAFAQLQFSAWDNVVLFFSRVAFLAGLYLYIIAHFVLGNGEFTGTGSFAGILVIALAGYGLQDRIIHKKLAGARDCSELIRKTFANWNIGFWMNSFILFLILIDTEVLEQIPRLGDFFRDINIFPFHKFVWLLLLGNTFGDWFINRRFFWGSD